MSFVSPSLMPTRNVDGKNKKGVETRCLKRWDGVRDTGKTWIYPWILATLQLYRVLWVSVLMLIMIAKQDRLVSSFSVSSSSHWINLVPLCHRELTKSWLTRPIQDDCHGMATTPLLGFLSFDLDDTLFPTDKVVDSANRVMIQRMGDLGVDTSTITMDRFLEATRAIRDQLTNPVTYTSLRKLVIAKVIRESMTSDGGTSRWEIVNHHDKIVDDCFEAWLKERHSAAERFLFPRVIDSLREINNRFPDACIGAITNGRGNPLCMSNSLQNYFDFCVSGEDDNVFPHRKPHVGIYEEALKQYRQLYPHHQNAARHRDYVWCHVGDCLANDVGASSAAGARAIWFNPHSTKQYDGSASSPVAMSQGSRWSTATLEETVNRDELSRRAQDDVAIQISCLSELPRAIDTIITMLQEDGDE